MLGNLERRIAFLREIERSGLLGEFLSVAEHALGKKTLNSSQLDLLVLRGGYSFFRNIHWMGLDLCQSILNEVIVTEAGINHSDAKAIVQKLCVAFAVKKSEHLSDESLIEFLVASVLGAHEEVIEQLGFGSSFFKRLKGVSQGFDSEAVHFGSEIDLKILKFLDRLAKEKEAVDWVEDLYRLKYLLMTEDRTPDNHETEIVFDALLELGMLRSFTKSKFLAFQKMPLSIEQLEKSGLIFLSYSSKNSHRWNLSENAYEITARAFAIKNLSRINKPKDLLKYHPIHQAAFIRELPVDRVSFAEELLKNDSLNISSKAFQAAILLLKRSDKVSLAFDLTKEIVTGKSSAWLRSIACHQLYLLDTNKASAILADVAQNDISAYVRGVALKGLIGSSS